MSFAGQEEVSGLSGRANQKRRTRNELLAAANRLAARGESPTLAGVAEEALVSRATVYRYFASQEDLLLQIAIHSHPLEDIARVLQESAGDPMLDRLDGLVEAVHRNCVAHEALHRTAIRHFQDAWLAAERAGDDHTAQLRPGQRRAWIRNVLEPIADDLAVEDLDRLVHALSLIIGGEPFIVLTDVCRLGAEEAIETSRWAARALVEAAMRRSEGAT